MFRIAACAALGMLLALGFADPPASAQPIDFADAPADAEVRPGLAVDREAVEPGGRLVLAVVLDHADGFHSQARAEELNVEGLIPTTIEATVTPGTAGPIQWPDSYKIDATSLFLGVDTIPVYKERAIFYIPVTVSPSAEVGDRVEIEVAIGFQACDDQVCLPPSWPEDNIRRVVLPVVGPGSAEAAATSPLFEGFDDSVFDDPAAFAAAPEPADASPEPAETETPAATSDAMPVGGPKLLGLIPLPSGADGPIVQFVGLALAAAVGGLILNLTPCVLPVIPIKIMTLTQHAGEDRGRTLMLGLSMATGVTAFWFALGIPAALVASFADPSRIFSFWFVTAPLGLLMILMALGLMGLFAINLPKSVYMVNPKADSASGSFMFGVMTGVLGLPCFGFVAGALIPAATTLGTTAVIVIFTAMGVGMAAPYLVLSAFPKLVERVPRTGPASELVKQVLGLMLIGFGLFFFGTGVRALIKTYPFTADLLHVYALAIAIAAAGGWLVWQTFRITRKPINRGFFGLVGLVIVSAALAMSVNGTESSRVEYVKRVAALEAAEGPVITTTWIDYSPRLFEQAKEAGKIVFLDFTADWCINCKVFEAQVLNKEPVRSRLEADDVVMMKVDMTGSNPAGDRLLKEGLDRVGIPTWAVVGPGGLPEAEIVEQYTPGEVLGMLERAATRRVASGG